MMAAHGPGSLISMPFPERPVVIVTSSTLNFPRPANKARAYTLVELVTVIAILAILAAIAGPRFFNQDVFRARGYADEMAGAIRYAQKVAIATGCSVQFTATTAGYQANQQAASGNHCNASSTSWSGAVTNSDGQVIAGAVPAGVTTTAFTLTFGPDGLLSSGGGASIAVGGRTLVVSTVSGYAEVQ
jgi:MSHA pilin protein MshC